MFRWGVNASLCSLRARSTPVELRPPGADGHPRVPLSSTSATTSPVAAICTELRAPPGKAMAGSVAGAGVVDLRSRLGDEL